MISKNMPLWLIGGLIGEIPIIVMSGAKLIDYALFSSIIINMPLFLISYLITGSSDKLFFQDCQLFFCFPNFFGWLILIVVYFMLGIMLAYFFNWIFSFFRNKLMDEKHF